MTRSASYTTLTDAAQRRVPERRIPIEQWFEHERRRERKEECSERERSRGGRCPPTRQRTGEPDQPEQGRGREDDIDANRLCPISRPRGPPLRREAPAPLADETAPQSKRRPRRSTQAPRARSPRSQHQQPPPSTKAGGSSEPAPPPPPRRSSAPLSAPISVARNPRSCLDASADRPRTVHPLGPRPSSGHRRGSRYRSSRKSREKTRSPNPAP